MIYKFHPFAETEFEDSSIWYSLRSNAAKDKFIREVLRTVEVICKNPTAFPIVSGQKRRVPLKKFPFSIIYVVDEKSVTILSIFHHSRNPNIWKTR